MNLKRASIQAVGIAVGAVTAALLYRLLQAAFPASWQLAWHVELSFSAIKLASQLSQLVVSVFFGALLTFSFPVLRSYTAFIALSVAISLVPGTRLPLDLLRHNQYLFVSGPAFRPWPSWWLAVHALAIVFAVSLAFFSLRLSRRSSRAA